MFTASKSYFYQNSGRIHSKCVLHIQKYSQNIRHIYYNIAKCSTYEKMPSYSYTIQFTVYVTHEFKFIINMFFNNSVCHGMAVPGGKAVYISNSAKIAPV